MTAGVPKVTGSVARSVWVHEEGATATRRGQVRELVHFPDLFSRDHEGIRRVRSHFARTVANAANARSFAFVRSFVRFPFTDDDEDGGD